MSPRQSAPAVEVEDALQVAQREADEAAARYAEAQARAERLREAARQRAAQAAAEWDEQLVEGYWTHGRQAERDAIAEAHAAYLQALAESPVVRAYKAWRKATHHGRVLAHEVASIAQHRALRPTSSVEAWQIVELNVAEVVRQIELEADTESRAEIDALLAQRDEAAVRAAEGEGS